MNQFEREYINDIIEAISDIREFKTFIAQSTEQNWYRLASILEEMDCYCAQGASKGVIMVDDCDYVLKLPFLWEERWITNSTFTNPQLLTECHNHDYCKLEWRNYLLAQQAKIEQCFAYTELVRTINGYPIYLQEKIDCDEYAVSDAMYDSSYRNYLNEMGEQDTEEMREYYSDHYCVEEDDMVADLICDVWGENIGSRFLDFCDDNRITDKHSGNFGYRDDKLVIVDFSGFGWYPNNEQQTTWFSVLTA